MNTERDKFLTEAMNECWHEPNNWPHSHSIYAYIKCSKCGANYPAQFIDFSGADGFLKLWDWAIEQQWWNSNNNNLSTRGFVESLENLHYNWLMRQDLIHPDRFANAIYEFLQRK